MINDVLATDNFDSYREAQRNKSSYPGQILYYPTSQIPRNISPEELQDFKLMQNNISERKHNLNSSTNNRNMVTLGYSSIDPIMQRDYASSLGGTIPIAGTFSTKDYQYMERAGRNHVPQDQEIGSPFNYTGLFGPADFNQSISPVNIQNSSASPQIDSKVNFRDRYTQGATHMDTRGDERYQDAELSHREGRNQGGLKSSMKYSKPPCLQNTSALGMSMTGKQHMSLAAINNRTVHVHGDHDDLRLKLEKLSQKFLDKHKEKDAFRDTFFDEEIYGEELKARNYFKVSLDLLKYALHSANQPKKKAVDAKKAGGLSLGARR